MIQAAFQRWLRYRSHVGSSQYVLWLGPMRTCTRLGSGHTDMRYWSQVTPAGEMMPRPE